MPAVRWSRGGEADPIALDGERIALRSTVPSAPGTPLEGSFADHGAIRVKVARCRRQDDGSFTIEGRLIDASRDLKAALLSAVPPPAA